MSFRQYWDIMGLSISRMFTVVAGTDAPDVRGPEAGGPGPGDANQPDGQQVDGNGPPQGHGQEPGQVNHRRGGDGAEEVQGRCRYCPHCKGLPLSRPLTRSMTLAYRESNK